MSDPADPRHHRTAATVIHTDGSCLYPDPAARTGPGGWAWVHQDGTEDSGGDAATTNQRMELRAAVEAVVAHPDIEVELVTDSAYVANCWRDRWWEGWLARGWKTSARKPVAHRDLWERLVPEFASGRVQVSWVKGHTGDPGNERADLLARQAAETTRDRAT